MKIININPGLLPIPPNGWGAIEKIIWDYHLQLQTLGLRSEIKYLDEVKYDESCIIHVHVANLANMLHERGVPYIFTIHDHHAYLYGKESHVFKENLKAIENSVFSLSPCKYLIPYFGSKKLRYFGHAVNTAIFNPTERSVHSVPKLLCVANNGYSYDQKIDRKGFKFAIEAAMRLNMTLTIAGPKNNENFFSTLPDELNNYSGLTKLFNLNEEELVKLYRDHDIFLHPSELEAGHPNLTLLEAMACGLPVVGTFEENAHDGMVVVARDTEQIIAGIMRVVANLDSYKRSALNNAIKNSYSNRVYDLTKLYSEYRERIFANQFIDVYSAATITDKTTRNRIKVSFEEGAKIDIGGPVDKKYKIKFIDSLTNRVVYESIISNRMWSSASIRYYMKWVTEVYDLTNGYEELVDRQELDLKNKPVKIVFDSNSLGDIIAWIGAADEFQKKHQCKLECVVFNKYLRELFETNYSNIKFLAIDVYADPYYAKYRIGCFQDDTARNGCPSDYRTLSLCQIATNILGLSNVEFKPKLNITPNSHDKKYVCIASQSTCQAKYWNNQEGWKTVIAYLKSKGYEVWCVDRHNVFGVKEKMNYMPEGCIDKTGDYSLAERLSQIAGAEFFIGLSSGLSWMAWAVETPVVMISGFTKKYNEFQTPYRVINENVCNGCWNDTSIKFDPANWAWCPRQKDFECSKQISAEMVLEQVRRLTYIQ